MAKPDLTRMALLAVSTAVSTQCIVGSSAVAAQGDDSRLLAIETEIKTMQRQHDKEIRALHDELNRVRRDLAARDAQLRAAQPGAFSVRAGTQAAQVGAGQPVPLAAAPQAAPPASAPAGTGSYQAITGQAAVAQRSLGATVGTPGPASPANVFGGPLVQQPSQVPANLQSSPYTPNVPGTVAQEQAAAVGTPNSTFRLGGVTVTFGGFVELASIFRSRNEVSDIVSNFNTTIPLPQSALYHEPEFRFTSRQSRISVLVQGKPDEQQILGAYLEADFLSAAPTANANELNGYSPRLRQVYATYDNTDWHFHLLAGQSWSLITPDQVGIIPRQENIPLTIDADFVPGFTWARQPELRATGDFDNHRLWLAASLENPQTIYYVGSSGAVPAQVGTVNYQNPGGVNFAPTVNYSDEVAPDVVVKAAYDPGWGHYEIYGLARFLHDRVSVLGSGHNDVALAGGGGVTMILPLIPGKLTFQASGLAGYGVGRYASGQFPDATLSRSGAPVPLPEVEALIGLVGKPAPMIDLYSYVGTEQIGKYSFNVGTNHYGYGNLLYSNTGCDVELSPLACTANTSGIVQGTLGGWWRFLKGGYGTLQAGAQYSYTRRSIFAGVGGNPVTDENMVFFSLRYLPFQ